MVMNKGLILLVHGSKDPEWIKPFERMRGEVAEGSPGVRVELACLQFCEPELSKTVSMLAGEGIGEIVIAPVFISALGHVLNDVPAAVDEAISRFPDLKVTVTEALGETPEVMEAMRKALSRLLES